MEGAGIKFQKGKRAVLDKGASWPADGGAGQTLTKREVEVAGLVSQGLANKTVAKQLGVREGTVKIHLHNIYRKLGVSNRAELILSAIANHRR